MNKKGNVRDVILIGIIIFAIGLGFFVVHNVMGTAVNTITDHPEVNSSDKAVESFNMVITMSNRLDYIVFGLFMALVLALIITSYFIGGQPIFITIYLIVIVMGVILSALLANTWETITQASVFGSTITSFPLTNNLILYMPIYLSVVGMIAMFIMFGKPYFRREYG